MPSPPFPELACVNGRISPVDEATIPVADHGFLYGDSVYETIRTYRRRPFLVARHLARLSRSASAIRLALPWSDDHIAAECRRTVEAGGEGPGEYAIRIIATRGSGPFGYDPRLTPDPNLVILARRLEDVTPELRRRGVAASISSIRRNPIESLDPRIKSSNLLNNILAAFEARDAGSDDAVLFNTSGCLAEATQSNVFFAAGGVLHTPSLDCGLLSGVTRDLVIELARRLGIECREGRYDRRTFDAAEEIFLTSTTREVLPVTRLDGRAIGAGEAGPVTRRLQDAWSALVDRFLRDGESSI